MSTPHRKRIDEGRTVRKVADRIRGIEPAKQSWEDIYIKMAGVMYPKEMYVSPKTARAIAKLATLGSGHSMSKENFFGGIKIIEVAGIKSPSEA
jgi:hypothetical protein